MNNLLRFLRGHEPDVTALSARLDGELEASASARLDEHLAACDACRGVLDGLRATRDALRALPEVEATRSFRLRAADVELVGVSADRGGRDILRWAPALGVVAAAVFLAVLAVDLRSDGGGLSTASAPNAVGQASHDSGGLAESKSAGGAVATPPAGVAAPARNSAATSLAVAPEPASAVPPAAPAAGIAGATPNPALQGSERYGNTAADTATTTARGDVAATSAAAGHDGGGNNSTALHVIEIIAGAAALAAMVAVIIRRRRGDGA